MKYSFTRYALRELGRLPRHTQTRLINKLRFYLGQENPMDFAEKIEASGGKVYRFRVGDHRIIFDWAGDEIVVLRVRDRRDAYR